MIGERFKIYTSIALSNLGKTVDTVLAAVHEHGLSQNLYSPVFLSLMFKDQSRMRISCGSDGETVQIDEEFSKSYSLDEYGSIKTVDVSFVKEFANVAENTVSDIRFLISAIGDRFVGLSIIFADGTTIYVANVGDELRYFNVAPEIFMSEEKIDSIDIRDLNIFR